MVQYNKRKIKKIVVLQQDELHLIDPDRKTIIEYLPNNLK